MAAPRLYQIATLASLLVYGMARLDFEITAARAALILAVALATQAVCDGLARGRSRSSLRPGAPPSITFLQAVNTRSALISGLSLCLLLRTDRTEMAAVAAVLAISSQFLIRCRGKHLFNPTNGGLVAMMLLTDQVWVSPGQWGSTAFFGFLVACLGGLVVNRAMRGDVTYAFIGFYGA